MIAYLIILREMYCMNNWDVRPVITVILGASDVPPKAVHAAVLDTMSGIEHWESSTIVFEGDRDGSHNTFEVINGNNITDDHLSQVMNSLRDHMDNVPNGQWLEHQSDLLVDEKEWLWVDLSYGRYFGPNCTVDVWYITI